MRTALALAALVVAAPALAADPKPPADKKAPVAATKSTGADQKAAAAGQKGDAAAAAAPKSGKTVQIKVNDAGFEPREVKVKKGEPTTLVFTRVTDRTCITAIDIPDENVKKFKLPLNQPVSLTITPKKAGVEAFHCSAMAMGNGKLIVEE